MWVLLIVGSCHQILRPTMLTMGGNQVIIKWRGKPVFIRHRTESEIAEANKVNVQSLRDPQSDEDRVQKPEWLVMLGTFKDISWCLGTRHPSTAMRMLTICSHRRLYASGLCPHWRGRRLRWMVLSLPRLPLRHFWPYKERTGPAEPRNPAIRFPRR